MEFYREVTFWFFETRVWVILGLVLVTVDVFVGSMVLLPLGIACLLTGTAVFSSQQMWFGDFVLFETWRDVAFLFATLSVLSVLVVKRLFQKPRRQEPDINDY